MISGRLPLCFAALVVALAQARASPLDAETCAKLTSEHAQLELAGVESNLAKGPDWAKLSLPPEQLAQIRRYIELEEQLLFRCRDKSLVKLAPEPDPGSTSEASEHDKGTPKAAAPPPARNSKAPAAATKKKTESAKKAAVAPASKAAVGKAKQDPGGAKAKPPAKAAKKPADAGVQPGDAAAKRPPKAKVDDANKAPPPGPAATPK